MRDKHKHKQKIINSTVTVSHATILDRIKKEIRPPPPPPPPKKKKISDEFKRKAKHGIFLSLKLVWGGGWL